MRLQFLPADALHRYDGVMSDRLWNHIPNFVNENPDVWIVPISYFSDYKFSPELLHLRGKKYIIADTMEYYGQWPDGKSHLFGISETPAFGGNPEWQRLSRFVRENPPILQLVRELYKDDVSKFIQPLCWPAYSPAWELEPKLNYDTRPFEVFFQYGISSCYRPMLHGDMLKNSCKHGYEVINSIDHMDAKIGQPGRKWCAVHQPHSHRVPISEVVRRQAQSKITVSLGGAGVVCFRSTEAPVHSLPAIHSPSIAWPIDWVHGVNCIHLELGNEWEGLNEAVKRSDLHELYLAAQRTIDQYRMPNFWNNYIWPAIERVL